MNVVPVRSIQMNCTPVGELFQMKCECIRRTMEALEGIWQIEYYRTVLFFCFPYWPYILFLGF